MAWTDIIAIILGLTGLVGCILPVIPGPPLSWAGLLVLFLAPGTEVSTTSLFIWLAVVVLVTVLDYVVPSWMTRATGGSKAAGRGAFIGTLVGLFFFAPWGIIVGPFAGALVAELLFARKDLQGSMASAFGAFMGFISSTLVKLIISGIILYKILKCVIG